MADVQIAVIDQQNTQIALAAPSETQVNAAVPGIQGPVGEGVPAGGTANQVLFKQSGTDYDTAWSSVTSAMIGDLEIVNADVAAAAAIAGTKISPDFGAQNIVTTGTVTGASLNPTSSTVPTNGVYLPSANNVAISTNGTGRLFVDASGNVGVGTTSPGAKLTVVESTANTSMLNLVGLNNYVHEFQNRDEGNHLRFYVNSGAPTWSWASNATEFARIDSSGRLLVGTSSDSGGALLQVNGDRIRVGTAKTPASATDTGTAGEICWDANYVYVCIATNTWKRSALSTW